MGGVRPSGNLIIGGQTFKTDAPIVTWREPPYWDATREVCMITETDPGVLTPGNKNYCVGGVPYGKLPLGPYLPLEYQFGNAIASPLLHISIPIESMFHSDA